MPYNLNWYIQDQVTFMHVSGEITPEELQSMILDVNSLVNSSPRKLVHTIVDVGDITKSSNISDLVATLRDVGISDKTGWTVVIRVKSPIIKMGSAIGTSIFKLRTRFLDTIEEAEALLKEQDSTLSWDKVDKSILTD